MIGLVLSCEHASWTLPPGIDLGVPPSVLRSQAGWDHGAFEIASQLSDAVGLPVHTGAFSRMFVDLNRAPELDPVQRTYDLGVLYDPAHPLEAELAERLMFRLRGAGLDVRANQPYSGVGPAICTSLRVELGAPYAGIQFETSHAVTYKDGGCARVADAVAPFLESL